MNFLSYLKGLINLNVKIFVILFLIFLFLELIERTGFLTKGYKKIAGSFKFLGFSEKATAPLLAGIFFGIIYGAGVIADLINKEKIEKKQVLLVSVFLAICHAIFEDTGIFLALGANIFFLTIPRIIFASLITFLIARSGLK
ncbi:MAG: nucleoside recognition domain-containing protein [candidate division WOR-3 bacterium]